VVAALDAYPQFHTGGAPDVTAGSSDRRITINTDNMRDIAAA
jgi:hypothetical protein